jgi:uncharacterized protein (DUF427 family)
VRTIESVWEYPRPPRVEPTDELVIVTLGGETIAENRRSSPVLEIGHPPVYYVPFEEGMPRALRPAASGRTSPAAW